jgi:predicted dehydrogenase
MPRKLRVGILGAGFAAGSHAAAYGRLADVEVVALWSRGTERARRMADRLGYPDVRVHEDWQSLVSDGGCDVISIATAPLLRSDPLLAALACGVHVLVEKPMSVGVEEAGAMDHAARRAGSVTACCFNWRYAPAVQVMARAIRSGHIGAVRDIHSEWYFRTRRKDLVRTAWALRMDIANGSLGEGLSHDFDKARYVTGAEFRRVVSSVTPISLKPDGDFLVEGGRSMHLAELSGEVLAQFSFSLSVGQDRHWLLVVGDEGSLWIPDAGTTVIKQRYDDAQPVVLEIPRRDQQTTSPDLLQHTWNRLIEDFVAAVREDDRGHERHPTLAQLTDGLRTEQVIAAARRSSAERLWAAVDI